MQTVTVTLKLADAVADHLRFAADRFTDGDLSELVQSIVHSAAMDELHPADEPAPCPHPDELIPF